MSEILYVLWQEAPQMLLSFLTLWLPALQYWLLCQNFGFRSLLKFNSDTVNPPLENCTADQVSVYEKVFVTIINHTFQNILIIPQRNPEPCSSHVVLPHPWVLPTTSLSFLQTDLLQNFHICKACAMRSMATWPLPFAMVCSGVTHVDVDISNSLYLWMNNIPLFGYVKLCLSTHELKHFGLFSQSCQN